jgi:hypothetical protein
MATPRKRNPLLPWIIGIIIIVAADLAVASWMFQSGCQAPGVVQILVLVAIPVVYLVLAYLTFRSQD